MQKIFFQSQILFIDVNRTLSHLFYIASPASLALPPPQKADHPLLAEVSQLRVVLCPLLSLFLTSDGQSHPFWGQISLSSTAGVSGLRSVS